MRSRNVLYCTDVYNESPGGTQNPEPPPPAQLFCSHPLAGYEIVKLAIKLRAASAMAADALLQQAAVCSKIGCMLASDIASCRSYAIS